jgi:hypothetical protein
LKGETDFEAYAHLRRKKAPETGLALIALDPS